MDLYSEESDKRFPIVSICGSAGGKILEEQTVSIEAHPDACVTDSIGPATQLVF